jgi:hypothetical protein
MAVIGVGTVLLRCAAVCALQPEAGQVMLFCMADAGEGNCLSARTSLST